MNKKAICQVCGEPMPQGEEMFNFHGYSGPCPKPMLPPKPEKIIDEHICGLQGMMALHQGSVEDWHRHLRTAIHCLQQAKQALPVEGKTE